VFISFLAAIILPVIGFIGFQGAKYKFRKQIDEGELAKGLKIFDALHDRNDQGFKERLGRKNILEVRDRNKNNLFHKVADKNWTAEMTVFLEDQCETIFKQDNEDPENIKMNNCYSKRQQICCARLPHKTSLWKTVKSQINSWIIKNFGHGKIAKFSQIIFPLVYIDLNSQNESGKTPLHIAAEKNQLDIVKVLLDNGAKPTIKDNHHFTPLQRAVLNQQCDGNRKADNIEMVRLLFEKSEPMSKTANGQNILHSAVKKNNLEVIELIISLVDSSQKDQLLKETYSEEETENHIKERNLLTEKTPLELAAKLGRNKIVEYLVNEDQLWKTKNGGMEVIFSALSSSHSYIVDHLLQHGGTFLPDWVKDNACSISKTLPLSLQLSQRMSLTTSTISSTRILSNRLALEPFSASRDDNVLKKLIRDKNVASINILMDSNYITFEDQHLNDALDFAKAEKDTTKAEETDSQKSIKKNKNYKSPKEKIDNIITALERKINARERKKKNGGEEEKDFEKEELKRQKKEIEHKMKTIEQESRVVKENHRRNSLDSFGQRKTEIVKRLRQLQGTQENTSQYIPLSIETIESRLRNIKSDESTVSQKNIKHIMQLLEQTRAAK